MLAILVVSLALAENPRVAVVVTQRSGLSPERADAIAARVADMLSARGVSVSHRPKEAAQALAAAGMKGAECQGKRACVSGLGRVLRVWGVVGVELSDLDGTLAVHIELVDSDKGQKFAPLDLVMPQKKAEAEIASGMLAIVPAIRETLEAAAEPAPAAPPQQPLAEAAPQPAPQIVVLRPEEKSSRAPMAISFGAAAAAGAVAIVFVVLASQARAELQAHTTNATGGFDVTRAQAQAIASRANTDYTVSLACGIGAVALAVIGAVLGLTQ